MFRLVVLFVISCCFCFTLLVTSPPTQQQQGLDFLVLGDWGGLPFWPYKTDVEEHTSRQMAATAKQTNASFVVALGDNFYKEGVKDVDDPRFEETYSDVFNQPSLQIPWYVIGGNHDHYGNISAQVLYSKKNQLWRFPYFWHSKKWVIPGTNRTLKLVLVDTVLLCGNSGLDEQLQQPAGPEDEEVAEIQWKWLIRQLQYSRDDYLIVGGHFPVWSVAEHGPTHCLVNRLKPLLEKYKATTYISGHDHNLQHIVERKSLVNYFVVGCANYIDTSQDHRSKVPAYSSKFFWADASRRGGFAHARADKDYLVFTFIDSLGAKLHQTVMKPRFG